MAPVVSEIAALWSGRGIVAVGGAIRLHLRTFTGGAGYAEPGARWLIAIEPIQQDRG